MSTQPELPRDEQSQFVPRHLREIHEAYHQDHMERNVLRLNAPAGTTGCVAASPPGPLALTRKILEFSTRGTFSLAHKHFDRIQDRTRCLFVRLARLSGAPAYDRSLSLEANVDRAVPALMRFLHSFRRDGFDGFVFELPDPRYGQSESVLAQGVLLVLRRLSDQDPASAHCMNGPVGRTGWWFQFAGERLFVTVFAPCRAPEDPGDTFGLRSTFLLFRPDPGKFPDVGGRAGAFAPIRLRGSSVYRPMPATAPHKHQQHQPPIPA